MANTFSSKKWERKKIVYLLASYFKCCFPNREQLWCFQTLCIISGLVKSILKLWNLTPSSAISSPHPFPQIHLPHLLSLKDFGSLSPRVLSFRLLLTCVYSAEAHGLASPTQHMLHKKGIKDVSCWCIPMAWHRVWAYWLFLHFLLVKFYINDLYIMEHLFCARCFARYWQSCTWNKKARGFNGKGQGNYRTWK